LLAAIERPGAPPVGLASISSVHWSDGGLIEVPVSITAKGALKHLLDKHLSAQRHLVECCFSKLKHFRRFATRYEKSKNCFQSLVALACSWIILQLYVDTA